MTSHLRSQPPSRRKQEVEVERKGQGLDHGQRVRQGLEESQERDEEVWKVWNVGKVWKV